MANGFFLGGVAEGMADADKRQMEKDKAAQELGLRTRALDLTEARNKADIGINERAQTLAEKNAARVAAQQGQAVVDKHISDTMAVVGETVKNAVAAGRDPDTIRKAVAPLVESAMKLAPRAGRDPTAIGASVEAMLTGPTTVEAETAKAQGKATGEGLGKIAAAKALQAAGIEDENAGFKSKDERVKAENSLRDDYTKIAAPFTTMRDAKNRIDNLDKSGAGDMALIFQFMKILDPTSTVREGEFATAQNAAGLPEAIRGSLNRAIGAGRLSEGAREQIISQSNKIYDAAKTQHDKNVEQFKGIAKRLSLDPKNVVIDLTPVTKAISGVTPGGLKFSVGQ